MKTETPPEEERECVTHGLTTWVYRKNGFYPSGAPRKRYWRCRRCETESRYRYADGHDRPSESARLKRLLGRFQTESLTLAAVRHKGEEWSSRELALARDYRLTAREVARRTDRTFAAVCRMRAKLKKAEVK